MSNLSYSYVESGIVLNISSYADLKKLNVTPKHFAVFGEAFQFILDELDRLNKIPSKVDRLKFIDDAIKVIIKDLNFICLFSN